jgi:aspartate/methionine/tyrosine aminotransferase
VTVKTKMIFLNFPNNPTGSILARKALEAISTIVQHRNILILSDEIYENLIYDGKKFHSIISFPGIRDQAILVNGFSKAYAMTGWRLGYAVAPKAIAEKIRKVQENTTTCASSFCQIAAVEALKKGRQFVNNMIREFDHRREVLVHGLNKIRGVSCSMPKGTFYAFPNITKLGVQDNKLSEYMLKEAKVATVPGSVFGNQGCGHLRISYANSIENINKALGRIRDAVEKLLRKRAITIS